MLVIDRLDDTGPTALKGSLAIYPWVVAPGWYEPGPSALLKGAHPLQSWRLHHRGSEARQGKTARRVLVAMRCFISLLVFLLHEQGQFADSFYERSRRGWSSVPHAGPMPSGKSGEVEHLPFVKVLRAEGPASLQPWATPKVGARFRG